MFQRLMGYLVTRNRTRTLNQLARVTPFIHRHKSFFAAPISCSQTLSSLRFSTDTSAFTHHPVRLPEDLSKNLIVLSCESSAEGGVCHVYLVGTCHVSKESSRQVQAIVKFLKPRAVFLELCRSRASVLTREDVKIHVPTVKEMVTQLGKKQNIIEVLFRWFYAKVGSELGVLPGNEFRVAYEEAIKYGGKVILGDRPQQITLRRTWSKMPLWYIPKLLYFSLSFGQHIPISDDFVKMEREDGGMLPLIMQKMNKEFPILMETLVHERDRFMSAFLLSVARRNSSVVAVVGKAHLQGIKKHWKQPVVVEDLII